jgi:uncharacterized protein
MSEVRVLSETFKFKMQKQTTSPFIKVNKSKIHNLGVYASKDIPKGTKIIEYIGNKISKDEADDIYDKTYNKHEKNPSDNGAVYIFELNKKHDIDGNVSWNTARLINHSCSPNCEVDIINNKIWIISFKNIKKGEEISYDYGYDLDCYEDHPCKCGSPNCIGYIVSEEYWPKLKKILAKRK